MISFSKKIYIRIWRWKWRLNARCIKFVLGLYCCFRVVDNVCLCATKNDESDRTTENGYRPIFRKRDVNILQEQLFLAHVSRGTDSCVSFRRGDGIEMRRYDGPVCNEWTQNYTRSSVCLLSVTTFHHTRHRMHYLQECLASCCITYTPVSKYSPIGLFSAPHKTYETHSSPATSSSCSFIKSWLIYSVI